MTNTGATRRGSPQLPWPIPKLTVTHPEKKDKTPACDGQYIAATDVAACRPAKYAYGRDFSKVSLLLHLLYKVSVKLTFEKDVPGTRLWGQPASIRTSMLCCEQEVVQQRPCLPTTQTNHFCTGPSTLRWRRWIPLQTGMAIALIRSSRSPPRSDGCGPGNTLWM